MINIKCFKFIIRMVCDKNIIMALYAIKIHKCTHIQHIHYLIHITVRINKYTNYDTFLVNLYSSTACIISTPTIKK